MAATALGQAAPADTYFNTGLYNLNGTGDYPEPNIGLKEFTNQPSDMGRFKPPTLRNIAVTDPYMHDGNLATLDEVLDHYVSASACTGRSLYGADLVMALSKSLGVSH